MGKQIAMSRRRALPAKLAADFWKLSADQRTAFAEMVAQIIESNQLKARRKERLAANKGAVVSFRMSAAQYRLLMKIADARGRNIKPGAVAGQLFDWALPALEAIASDLDPDRLLCWSLTERWGQPGNKLRLAGAANSPSPEAS